jgi:hypothetical protein
MNPTATVETVDGNQILDAGNGVDDQLVVGDLTATAANISLTTTGSVLDADDASTGDDTDTDITAQNLRIVAGKGIGLLSGNSLGEPVNALEIDVDLLAAKATGSDGLHLVEADGLTVGDTGDITTTEVGTAGTTSTRTAPSLSDLVTTATNGANGSIVLQLTTGNLTLQDGTAPDDNTAVSANGTGNILLQSLAGAINANAGVASEGGSITLRADGAIAQAPGTTIQTDDTGTLDLESENGAVTLANLLVQPSSVGGPTGDVRIRAGGATTGGTGILAEESLTTLAGTVSLLADAGDLVGPGAAAHKIAAAALRMESSGGIYGVESSVVKFFRTDVATVSARAAGGSILLTNGKALTVGDTSATVERVGGNGTTTDVIDQTLSDLRTTGTPSAIHVIVETGTLTLTDGTAPDDNTAVSANGAGNVTLQANGTGGAIALRGRVLSGSGDITLRTTPGGITQSIAADLTHVATSGGRVTLNAGDGIGATGSSNLLRIAGAELDLTQTGNANVYLQADSALDWVAGAVGNSADSTVHSSVYFHQEGGALTMMSPSTRAASTCGRPGRLSLLAPASPSPWPPARTSARAP